MDSARPRPRSITIVSGWKLPARMPASKPLLAQLELVVVVLRQQLLHAVVEQLLGADEQHLVPLLFFEFAERHAVFLEEPDELLAGDAAVLAAGDAIPLQAAGIEPFGDGAGGNLTDLGDLSGGEHLFHGEALRLNSLRPRAPPSWAFLAGGGRVLANPRGEGRAAHDRGRRDGGCMNVRQVGPDRIAGDGRLSRPDAPAGAGRSGLTWRLVRVTRKTVATLTPSATPTARLRKTREFGRLEQAMGSGGVGTAGAGERSKADHRPPDHSHCQSQGSFGLDV